MSLDVLLAVLTISSFISFGCFMVWNKRVKTFLLIYHLKRDDSLKTFENQQRICYYCLGSSMLFLGFVLPFIIVKLL